MEPYTREEIDKIIQSISEITEENYQEPIMLLQKKKL